MVAARFVLGCCLVSVIFAYCCPAVNIRTAFGSPIVNALFAFRLLTWFVHCLLLVSIKNYCNIIIYTNKCVVLFYTVQIISIIIKKDTANN